MRSCLFMFVLVFALTGPALNHAATIEEKQAYYLRLARQVEPSLAGDVARTQLYLDRIKRLVLSDPYYFYWQLAFKQAGGSARVTGDVERPEFKAITEGVLKLLKLNGLDVAIRVIPEAGSQTPRFALVHEATAFMTDQPGGGGPMDEALYGEPVFILKEAGGHFLIKNHSGYWGYVDKARVTVVQRNRMMMYLLGKRVSLTAPLTRDGRTYPAGASFLLKNPGRAVGPYFEVQTVAGTLINVPRSQCSDYGQKPHGVRPSLGKVLGHARSCLGAPYKLGGRSAADGIDCSGLAQVSYECAGVALPRDARQQYLTGRLVGTADFTQALKDGDLLYFMDYKGRVCHTGIYLSGGRMIHATSSGNGTVQIHGIRPNSPDYYKFFEKGFIAAKRHLSQPIIVR